MLGSVLDNFPQTAITVVRNTAPFVENGIATRLAPELLSMSAVVTPVSGKELDRLPEGLRTRQVKMFLVKEKLNTANDNDRSSPDRIEMNGERYQVERVEDWSDHGYFRAFGVRQEAV